MNLSARELENYTITLHEVRDQLKRHVYDRSLEAFASGDRARDAITDPGQLEARRTAFRNELLEAIGGLPSCDTPLNARVTGVLQSAGYRIENIVFESRPAAFVTGNLYVPNGRSAPGGAVLFLCGHYEEAKHHEEYQAVIRQMVLAGLVVLAIDPIGQGERLSYYEESIRGTTVPWGIHEHDYAGLQCLPLGDGLARYFVHDAMRAVDYLCTRSEVDPSRIGVTGNSGGGTQTALMMVCDPRIAAAAPATFIMNRRTMLMTGRPQDAEQIWRGMTALGFDHEDILICMAPRPVLVLAATYDYFPIEGTRTTVARTKRFWNLYGKAGLLALEEDVSDHRYTVRLAQAAARFFSLHLLGKEIGGAAFAEGEPLDPSLLRCTTTGQVRSAYLGSRAVYEENVDRLHQVERQRKERPAAENRARAVQWLEEKVYHSRKPCELNPRVTDLGQWDEISVQSLLWWAQEGLLNHGFLCRHVDCSEGKAPLTIAVWDQGTREIGRHRDWLRETCASGRSVLVLDVSGVGPLLPYGPADEDPLDFYGVIYKLANDLFWLNDSLAALRVYDVIRAIDAAEKLPGVDSRGVRLFAHGLQGLYAQLAAFLDPRVEEIEASGGMNRVADWVASRHYDRVDRISAIVPEMLAYFDLTDCMEKFEK